MVLGFGWRKTRFPNPPAVAGYRRSTGRSRLILRPGRAVHSALGRATSGVRGPVRGLPRGSPFLFLSLLRLDDHAGEEKPRGDDEGRKEQERGAARAGRRRRITEQQRRWDLQREKEREEEEKQKE